MAGKTFLLQSAVALSLFTTLLAYARPIVRTVSCTGEGDPHYTTFDGTYYHFQGTCRYVAAKPCKLGLGDVDWSVEVKNYACSPTVSCLETVFVKVYGKEFVLIDSTHLGVNPAPPASPVGLPYTFYFSGSQYVTVMLVGGAITLTTDFGLTVRRSGFSFEILLPAGKYFRNTCGLCGLYDNDGSNDMRLPDGSVTTDVDGFGNSWLMIGSCCKDRKTDMDGNVRNREVDMCSPEKEEEARRVCSILASDVFAPCHAVVDPKSVIESCTYDVCVMGSNDAKCEILQEYARRCRQNGVAIDWRKEASCPLECPEGMVYQLNGLAKTPTCDDREPNTDGDRDGIEGCFCPEGTVLLDSKCVDPKKCEGRHGEDEYAKA